MAKGDNKGKKLLFANLNAFALYDQLSLYFRYTVDLLIYFRSFTTNSSRGVYFVYSNNLISS